MAASMLRSLASTAITLGLLICLSPSTALAQSRITVLITLPTPATAEFTDRLRNELDPSSGVKLSVVTEEMLNNGHDALNDDSLVIAVGVQALSQASKLDLKRSVLGVLVPQPSFDKILVESRRTPRYFSAVFLDQPYARQIALLKSILPKATNLGVLFGPTSLQSSYLLQQASQASNLTLVQENIYATEELPAKLRRALETSAVLLAVPDALVYNRETAQSVLLTSYRYQKPVIGFSQAYVRAGALAAVYSTPQQIARQAAEIIRQHLNKPQAGLPPPQAPKYFSVDVNRQVARSLGIEIGDENALSDTLQRIERPLP
jgi:putative ABC transport system substrate-binding protein